MLGQIEPDLRDGSPPAGRELLDDLPGRGDVAALGQETRPVSLHAINERRSDTRAEARRGPDRARRTQPRLRRVRSRCRASSSRAISRKIGRPFQTSMTQRSKSASASSSRSASYASVPSVAKGVVDAEVPFRIQLGDGRDGALGRDPGRFQLTRLQLHLGEHAAEDHSVELFRFTGLPAVLLEERARGREIAGNRVAPQQHVPAAGVDHRDRFPVDEWHGPRGGLASPVRSRRASRS